MLYSRTFQVPKYHLIIGLFFRGYRSTKMEIIARPNWKKYGLPRYTNFWTSCHMAITSKVQVAAIYFDVFKLPPCLPLTGVNILQTRYSSGWLLLEPIPWPQPIFPGGHLKPKTSSDKWTTVLLCTTPLQLSVLFAHILHSWYIFNIVLAVMPPLSSLAPPLKTYFRPNFQVPLARVCGELS